MSVFSGLTPENLRAAYEAARSSPDALAALLVACAFAVLAVALSAAFIARGVGGFHAHVHEEEERLAREEEEEASQTSARRAQNDEEETEK